MSETKECVRKGIKDLWGARLVHGAKWTPAGNPVVATTMAEPPSAVVGWREARRIHRERLRAGDVGYCAHALVHAYTDDQNFDGARAGIWADFDGFVEVVCHFEGACVDPSTYADMPEPVLRWQVYRMRALEFALAQAGVPVIVNARWGTRETWHYTIDELPEGAMLAIGTVASGLKRLENRPVFEAGLRRIMELKNPTHLVVVGSASLPVFDDVRARGVNVVQFEGETSVALNARKLCACEAGDADE